MKSTPGIQYSNEILQNILPRDKLLMLSPKSCKTFIVLLYFYKTLCIYQNQFLNKVKKDFGAATDRIFKPPEI